MFKPNIENQIPVFSATLAGIFVRFGFPIDHRTINYRDPNLIVYYFNYNPKMDEIAYAYWNKTKTVEELIADGEEYTHRFYAEDNDDAVQSPT